MGEIDQFLHTVAARANSQRQEEEFRYFFLTELDLLCKRLGVPADMRLEERTLRGGRKDARLGGLIFEFKKPFRLDEAQTRQEAVRAVTGYLEDEAEKGDFAPSKLQCMITDGKTAALVGYNIGTQQFAPMDVYERLVEPSLAFVPLGQTAIWLQRALQSFTKRELSPDNLLEDFGPGSPICGKMVGALWELFKTRRNVPKVKNFFDQWAILFSKATSKVLSGHDVADIVRQYGIDPRDLETEDDVRSFLYVVHTYYALILKLLAVRIIDELELVGRVSLLQQIAENPQTGLQKAEQTLPLLAANLFERDVFSWFEDSSSDVDGAVREMSKRFVVYDVEGVRRDVLKRVYQNIVPPKLRKALGEFYTKDWTAELVLDEVGYVGNGSLLDPSCGSGTFLATAIQRRKRKLAGLSSEEAIREILGSIVGFDVNPIAVITARTNYLLSMLDLLKDARLGKGIEIPVYLCDSVVLPQEKYDAASGFGKVYLLPTAAIPEVRIPSLPRSPGMEEPEHVVLRTLGDYANRSDEEFLAELRSKLGPDVELQFRPALRSLHEAIAALEKAGVDGIWARLIDNFFAPLFITPFDFVVGNPPWVAPVHVPKSYRDIVEDILEESGFQESYDARFQTAKARFRAAETAFVACLPFVHLALTRYVKPGGRLAFLMTSSLVRSLNAGGWREKMLDCNLSKVIDLTLITDIHEGASSWSFIPVVVNEKSTKDEPVGYTFLTRKGVKPSGKRLHPEDTPSLRKHVWNIHKNSMQLSSDPKAPWQIGPQDVLSIFSRMRKFPRLGDYIPINMGVKTDANKVYFFGRTGEISPEYAKLKNGFGHEVLIEKDLLFPSVRGEELRAWGFDYDYLLIPHDSKTWRTIPPEIMERKYRESLRYLEQHRKMLERRALYAGAKGRPFYTIFEISTEKVGSWMVAYKDIATELTACVLPPKIQTELHEKARPLIIDHSVYYLRVGNEAEAHYIAAMLNSTPLRAYTYCLARPKGGAPFRGFLQWVVGASPIPPYEVSDKDKEKLRELSVSAHRETNPSRRLGMQEKIDEIVGGFYGITDHQMRVLHGYLSLLQGRAE